MGAGSGPPSGARIIPHGADELLIQQDSVPDGEITLPIHEGKYKRLLAALPEMHWFKWTYFHERALLLPERCSQGHSADNAASGGDQFFFAWPPAVVLHRAAKYEQRLLLRNSLRMVVVGSTFYPPVA
jgi:hypothetical protein